MNNEFGPVTIAGLQFESPIMNGAGPIKLVEDVLEIAQSKSAAIVVGSITIEDRIGNEGVTYFADPNGHYSLNSKGLPNPGLAYYQDYLPQMAQIAADYGKPLIISAAGSSPDEYALLAYEILNGGASGVEINLGCPNIWSEDGKQKRIPSFDPTMVDEILHKIKESVGSNNWISVKLSPISDPFLLQEIAHIINRAEFIKAAVGSNTYPNAFSFNEREEQAIEYLDGLAGMAGYDMKPIIQGQVKQLRRALSQDIALFGVGGISSRSDVEEYMHHLVGADAVQITTAYINVGPEIFSQILS